MLPWRRYLGTVLPILISQDCSITTQVIGTPSGPSKPNPGKCWRQRSTYFKLLSFFPKPQCSFTSPACEASKKMLGKSPFLPRKKRIYSANFSQTPGLQSMNMMPFLFLRVHSLEEETDKQKKYCFYVCFKIFPNN